MSYGFIQKDNDANEYPFFLKLEANDPLYEIKKSIIGRSSMKFRLGADSEHENFPKCLSFLRICVFDGTSQEFQGVFE